VKASSHKHCRYQGGSQSHRNTENVKHCKTEPEEPVEENNNSEHTYVAHT
jgi:hypothetical protein